MASRKGGQKPQNSIPSLKVSPEDLIATSRKYGTDPLAAKTLVYLFCDRGLNTREIKLMLGAKGVKLRKSTLIEYRKRWKRQREAEGMKR